MKKEGDKRSTPVTSKDGLDVHSEEILDLMDVILPSGSLISNVTLTDNDPNDTIIPGKSMKDHSSQLEVEEE